MNTLLWVLLILALFAAWYFVRRAASPDENTRPEPVKRPGSKKSAYHAVSIRFGKTACLAARELAGRRFLSSAAPRLPLPECDAAECDCRFRHHDDRRSGKDRRNPFSPAGISSATGRFEHDKRSGRDRRRDEDDDF